jgi:aminoglycoside 6'-N-acetyltransferase I
LLTTRRWSPSSPATLRARSWASPKRLWPVAFLEGIYVRPTDRRKGVTRSLVDAIEAWGREHGCAELASDALLDNTQSHGFHAAAGFEETERVVFFRKRI